MTFVARDLMGDVFPAGSVEVGGGWCQPITTSPCPAPSLALRDSGEGTPELAALPVLREQLRQALKS